MTATEELRKMLDERGVEWEGQEDIHTDFTFWCGVHACETGPNPSLAVYHLTPEQAIAATLGTGTCKQEEHGWSTEGDHARVWLTCGHDCMVETVADLPNFCPFCGAKVVVP